MTLPVPLPTAPLADTYQHINDLRTAAIAAVNAMNFVTIDNVTVNSNSSGQFTYAVPGLTTVQGVIFQHKGTATITIIVRAISGKNVTGEIWIADTGSNKWTNNLWVGALAIYGYAWGVK